MGVPSLMVGQYPPKLPRAESYQVESVSQKKGSESIREVRCSDMPRLVRTRLSTLSFKDLKES